MISPLMFTASFMFLTILLLIGVIYSRKIGRAHV